MAKSDEKLILRFRRTGDSKCLDELIHRHTDKIRRVIYSMVLNDDDADELTQESFLRAFKGLKGFGGRAEFSTWLYRIALNTTYSFLERRGRTIPENAEGFGTVAAPRELEPEEGASFLELEDWVDRALKRLSPPLRTAIVLHVLHGMKVNEIADVAGCKPQTVYWRVHEARRLLNVFLERFLKHDQ
ncbi:MAG: RNA polymerase sigma factor [Planctomycetota bacterium]